MGRGSFSRPEPPPRPAEPEPKPNGHDKRQKKAKKLNEEKLIDLLLKMPEVTDIIARNTLSAYDLAMHPVPSAPDDRRYPRPWEDTDTLSLLVWLQRNVSQDLGEAIVGRAVKMLAVANAFNPLQQRLENLEWDGKPRVDLFLVKALGLNQDDVARSRYQRAVSRAFVWAIVSRAMEPGVKFDCMLILEGGQGIGKSRFCAALTFNEAVWFTDSLPPITNASAIKDAREMLLGKMVIEMAELTQFRGTRIEVLKSFLSCPIDTVRLPYLGRSGAYHRSCVMVGTTNETEYLTDVTGNRRFWPVACGRIDLEYVEANLEQVYAEAMHAWREAGGRLRLWLPDDIEEIAKREQESRREHDPEEPEIVEWINGKFYDGVQFIHVRPKEYLKDTRSWTSADFAAKENRAVISNIGRIMNALGGTSCPDKNGSRYTFRNRINVGET